MKPLLRYLAHEKVRKIDVDGAGRMSAHRAVLDEKPMLRDVFVEFHHLFQSLSERHLSGTGLLIELGAGVAPMKITYPSVLASDIVPSAGLDCILDAQSMDLEDGAVRAFFCQNCFHHFPEPEKFFMELERVLVDGGGAILIEPHDGPVARFLFARLFSTEGYDRDFPSWNTPVAGPMNGANQALAHLVFKRDRHLFEERFPGLEIVLQQPAGNYLRYLLSGGLNFRQLVPDFAVPLVRMLEWVLTPLNGWLALHQVIVLRKSPR